MATFDDIIGSGSPATARKSPESGEGENPRSTSGFGGEAGAEALSGDQGRRTQDTGLRLAGPDVDATRRVGRPGEAPKAIPVAAPQMNYVQMYEMFNPNKPETEEDLLKREKREKREAIISAVGDGISALSNLWYTSRYAPNAYTPSKGMSAATKERWEKLRQTREANSRAYFDGYMRAWEMDEANRREDRKWQHALEREKVQDQLAEAKEKREEKKAEQNELMFQAKYALQLGRLTEQGYRNAIAEVKAGKILELTDAQINRLNRSGRGQGTRGAGKSPGEFPWYDENGGKHYAHSEKAMRANSIDAGTWNETTATSTSEKTKTSAFGDKETTKTTTTKPGKGYSSKPKKYGNTAKINW